MIRTTKHQSTGRSTLGNYVGMLISEPKSPTCTTKAVKGINLIILYYMDSDDNSQPVNYRLYNPEDKKTKNDYFLDMLDEVIEWGIKPSYVTADSWYSPIKNLKHISNHGLGFMVAVKANRTVSIKKGSWTQIQSIEEIDESAGKTVWLKDFGEVQLYRTYLKDQARHYIILHPQNDDNDTDSHADFKQLHDNHWQIETYHRALKQLCSIEKFQVRKERLIRNHIFASIMGFVYLKQNVLRHGLTIYT